MDNFSQAFNDLEENVKQLIQKKGDLELRLEEQQKEMKAMTEMLAQKEMEMEELKEKNKILRIAGGAKGEDKREIKLKINEMVREIDKCIAQLNQ
jgi:chromosome segregation ATPase